jgi:predicted component of type VI protein secretion system
LGENFICGGYVSDYDPVMEFVIGPLKNSSIEDFLENGSYSRFLSSFYSFFVPVEMETITTVKASETKQQFILNDTSAKPILGYNSGI